MEKKVQFVHKKTKTINKISKNTVGFDLLFQRLNENDLKFLRLKGIFCILASKEL